MKEKIGDKAGQMTVELCVVLPVVIVIAVVLVNTLWFASDCASFDRVARNCVRIEGVSPRIRDSVEEVQSKIESTLKGSFDGKNQSVRVWTSGKVNNIQQYTCELTWSPTIFGLDLKDSIFGVHISGLKHEVVLSIFPYKPGDFL